MERLAFPWSYTTSGSDTAVGKADTFPGLLGLINDYVDTLEVSEKDRTQINRYLDLVKRRANGSLNLCSLLILR